MLVIICLCVVSFTHLLFNFNWLHNCDYKKKIFLNNWQLSHTFNSSYIIERVVSNRFLLCAAQKVAIGVPGKKPFPFSRNNHKLCFLNTSKNKIYIFKFNNAKFHNEIKGGSRHKAQYYGERFFFFMYKVF